MEAIKTFVDLFLHLDKYLNQGFIQTYGGWIYLLLFVVIFCETGLVVTPFLPGDSLIFAAGALVALDNSGTLNIFFMIVLLCLAAIAGDTVNYFIGKFIGRQLLARNLPFVKPEYLERTHQFYEKYGGKTIILARFVPIVRTFAPFVAGLGTMNYKEFITYNIVGGIIWVVLFSFAGYFIGGIEIVKSNFAIVEILIVLLSLTPVLFEVIRSRRTPPAAPLSKQT